jgi:acetyltransferase EpsM
MTLPIVIVGAGGHARVVADIVRLCSRYSIVGYLDEVNPERRGTAWNGAAILGGLEEIGRLRSSCVNTAFVAVGDCDGRLRIAERLVAAGFELPVLCHPSAIAANDVSIGAGTVLAAGAIVNPGARVGANVIVNTSATVDHDCAIADGVHIAVGARLAGRVQVGRGTWIGMSANIKDGVRIGAGTIVGAGALVLKDLSDGVIAYGVPAKVVSHVESHHPVSR